MPNPSDRQPPQRRPLALNQENVGLNFILGHSYYITAFLVAGIAIMQAIIWRIRQNHHPSFFTDPHTFNYAPILENDEVGIPLK